MGYQRCHKVLRPGRGGKDAGPGERTSSVLLRVSQGDAGRTSARRALLPPPRYDDVCSSETTTCAALCLESY